MTAYNSTSASCKLLSLAAFALVACSGSAEPGHGNTGVGGATASTGGATATGGSAAASTGGGSATGATAGATGTDPVAQSCVDSGGTVTTSQCCTSLTADFPNNCMVGACGCSPQNSKTVRICRCPSLMCFDGQACVSS